MRSKRPLLKFLRCLARQAEHGFAVLGVLFVVYHVGFDMSAMSSPSMSPTLQGKDLKRGDRILTEKVSYWFRRPRRWEVMMFRTDAGEQRMKRVVGLPGEEVSLVNGEVAINGEVLPRPESLRSVEYYAYGTLFGGRSAPCRDGYFILGDDSADSQDSRYEGPLDQEAIVGRAWMVVWPLSRLGFVNP